MRSALLVALTIGLATVGQARQPRSLVADVERSEWMPPASLSLDLDSGRYSVKPPPIPWQPKAPKPQVRTGVLTDEPLAEVRRAFAEVVAKGLSDRKCVAAGGAGYDIVLSNAGVPRMTINAGGRRLSAAAQYGCWTPAASALHRLLEQLFDRRTP